MPIEINGEKYYTATEAAKYIGVSRETFYQNVRDHLQQYEHGAFRRVYYKQRELDQFKYIRPVDENS